MPPEPGRLFAPLEPYLATPVVVAVSGGGDSLALLVLLHERLAREGRSQTLMAITVDHRLRPESAAEAEWVAAFCAARGIAHRTLVREGARPRSGIAEAARAARYRLLADAAEAIGAPMVLTGHTLDDQAETVRMRLERTGDEGDRGLAGMAPVTLHDGRIWIVRPMLRVRRESLRSVLRARGAGWLDDPGNSDPAQERVRARVALAAAEGEVERLGGLADDAASRRVAEGEAAAGLIDRHAERAAPGLIRVAREMADEPSAAALLAWRLLLATAGGSAHLPERAATEGLLARMRAGLRRATLSRALVERRRDALYLLREGRDLPAGLPAAGRIWDGRYRIARHEGEGLPLSRATAEAAPAGPRAIHADAPQSLVGAALSRKPGGAGWSVGGLVASGEGAGTGPQAPVPVAAPFALYLSGFDLAAAAALHRLIGAPPTPPPPWADHIVPPG